MKRPSQEIIKERIRNGLVHVVAKKGIVVTEDGVGLDSQMIEGIVEQLVGQ